MNEGISKCTFEISSIDKVTSAHYRTIVHDPGLTSDIHLTGLHPCAYLPNRDSQTEFFYSVRLEAGRYESLLAEGWRRSGIAVYRPACPACGRCLQIRIPVAGFIPSESQLRSVRKNADVRVSIVSDLNHEGALELYRHYQMIRHGAETEPDDDDVRMFLGISPVESRLMLYETEDRLVGAGWVDILPEGVSSVYFAFLPSESKRSLGVFSIMRELELARLLGKAYLYLGYYVPDSRTMAYKANYRPYDLLVDGVWVSQPSEARLREYLNRFEVPGA